MRGSRETDSREKLQQNDSLREKHSIFVLFFFFKQKHTTSFFIHFDLPGLDLVIFRAQKALPV